MFVDFYIDSYFSGVSRVLNFYLRQHKTASSESIEMHNKDSETFSDR